MTIGTFITFEGPEGCGKSTQARLLANALVERGVDAIIAFEPGGTKVGEIIRQLVLSPETRDLSLEAEALLYAADRAQHINSVIKPALEAGRVVVCDRYVDSSVVYQGVAGGLGEKWVADVNELATGGLAPGLTFLIDCPPEVGLARARMGGPLDRIEQRTLEYHGRVRKAYLDIAHGDVARFVVVDSSSIGISELHFRIWRELCSRFPDIISRGRVSV